jgi:hypothetical protein
MWFLVEQIYNDRETKNQWKYHLKEVNDKQVHDVVVVETHVAILPFGAFLAYIIVPNSPIPTRWSNQNQWLWC